MQSVGFRDSPWLSVTLAVHVRKCGRNGEDPEI